MCCECNQQEFLRHKLCHSIFSIKQVVGPDHITVSFLLYVAGSTCLRLVKINQGERDKIVAH